MPDEGGSLTKALMSAVLLRAREQRQFTLDLDVTEMPAARDIEIAWQNASEHEKASRTIFAQRSLKPEEVVPEWDATRNALGGFEDTERFVSRALIRLGAALTPFKGGGYGAPLHLVPDVLKERLQAEGLLDDSPSPEAAPDRLRGAPARGLPLDPSRPPADRRAGRDLPRERPRRRRAPGRSGDPAALRRLGHRRGRCSDDAAPPAHPPSPPLARAPRAGVQHGRGGGRDRLCRRARGSPLGMRPSPCSTPPAAR